MALQLHHTMDGDLAARFHHLTMALIPSKHPDLGRFQIATAFPARNPSICQRSDFSTSGTWADTEAEFLAHVNELNDHYDEAISLGRRTIADSIPTIWGPSQERQCYYEGIERVSTAGHGGFILSPEMNELVDAEWRSSDCNYEEDETWAIVAFTFPHLFTAYESKRALRTLKNSYPDVYERLTGVTIPIEECETRRRRAFHLKHAGDYVVISALNSRDHPGYTHCHAAIGGRGDYRTMPKTTAFLVPADEYSQGMRPYGFVIDEKRHPRVNADGSIAPLPLNS